MRRTYPALGFAVDSDGYGMGGLGGSLGWTMTDARYAFAFVTGHVGTYDQATLIENAVHDCLGFPPNPITVISGGGSAHRRRGASSLRPSGQPRSWASSLDERTRLHCCAWECLRNSAEPSEIDATVSLTCAP